MDRLQRAHFLEELTGKVYLAQYDAWRDLHDATPIKAVS
jgi:SulP family sulfate permease